MSSAQNRTDVVIRSSEFIMPHAVKPAPEARPKPAPSK